MVRLTKMISIGLLMAAASQHIEAKYRDAGSKEAEKRKSIIYIDNENTKELGILIKPELIEDHTIDDEKRLIDIREGRWITFLLPASSMIEIEVPEKDIGEEVDLFSVTGETNPLTPIGRCYNLKMGKNYLLRFTDNAAGTDCISIELDDRRPFAKGDRISVPYSKSRPHHATDPEFSPNRPSQATR